jgi:hypothetical protein
MDPSNATSDDLNPTQYAAVIGFLLVLAVPVAAALAAWCKQRYARAVTQLQRSAAAAVSAPPASAAPAPAPAASAREALALPLHDAASVAAESSLALDSGLQLRRRLLTAQLLLGTGYWWILLVIGTLGLFAADMSGTSNEGPTETGSRLSLLAGVSLFTLPPLLAWAFQAGWRESRVWWGYGVGLVAIFGGMLETSSPLADSLVSLAAFGLFGLLMLTFLRPAVRGAGPPIVQALMGSLLALTIVLAVVAAFDDSADDAPIVASDWLLFFGVLVPLLAASAWLAWRLLMRLASRYAAKRFSDLQLAHDAYWSLITAVVATAVLMLSFEEKTQRSMEWLALAAALAWLGWRLAQRLARAWARRDAPPQGPALLLLRVFKPSARSEGFADRLIARWRFVGPVWMIAGPDLAGALMEPDEFFVWIGGRLRERFIAAPAQVAERVAALDGARDPDGRFRVSELFCAETTWRDAVLALIARADVVLLDLREFTPQRAGTKFELVQLLRRAPLAKVRVLVDARADFEPLRAAIAAAWAEAGRPASADDTATLHLLRIGAGSERELFGLARAAAQAASTRP